MYSKRTEIKSEGMSTNFTIVDDFYYCLDIASHILENEVEWGKDDIKLCDEFLKNYNALYEKFSFISDHDFRVIQGINQGIKDGNNSKTKIDLLDSEQVIKSLRIKFNSYIKKKGKNENIERDELSLNRALIKIPTNSKLSEIKLREQKQKESELKKQEQKKRDRESEKKRSQNEVAEAISHIILDVKEIRDINLRIKVIDSVLERSYTFFNNVKDKGKPKIKKEELIAEREELQARIRKLSPGIKENLNKLPTEKKHEIIRKFLKENLTDIVNEAFSANKTPPSTSTPQQPKKYRF